MIVFFSYFSAILEGWFRSGVCRSHMQQLSQGEGNVGDQNGGNGEFMGDRTLSLGGGCGFDVFLGNAGWRCD